MTLRVQLSLLLLLVTFIPIATFTYLNQQETSRQYMASKDIALIQANDLLVDAIDDYIKTTQEVLWADSYIPDFKTYLESSKSQREMLFSDVYEMLRSVIIKDSIFVNSAALLDVEGNNLMDTSAYHYSDDESQMEYFQSVIRKRDSYFSYQLVKDLQGDALYVSTPVKNHKGRVLGLLRLRIDPSRFQFLISKSLRKTSLQAILWDEEFTQLANLFNPEMIGTQGELRKGVNVADLSFNNGEPFWYVGDTGQQHRTLKSSIASLPWVLELSQSESEYTSISKKNYRHWLMQLGGVFISTLIGAVVVATYFVLPLKRVGDAAEGIAAGDYKTKVPVSGSAEVQGMARSLNKMTQTMILNLDELAIRHMEQQKAEKALIELNSELEERVEERTKDLIDANQKKSEALEQLIQSGKMAELGNLVAGVTHEVNTPLGNNVTVASSLEAQIGTFVAVVQAGKLTHKDLRAFIENCEFAVDILQKNCQRASELMGSFKQVAVDQTSMRRRKFSILDTVNEVITTLYSELKKHQHELHINLSMDLILDSYPGPFEQIITNLINNSLVHGLKETNTGNIFIDAHYVEGSDLQTVHLEYRDDGLGIPEDISVQVFDPFFTTRADEGGSGVGLYLVRTLAERDLGGELFLDQSVDKGVRFIFKLPVQAPER